MRRFDYSFIKTLSIDTGILDTAMRIAGLKSKDEMRFEEFPKTYSAMESAARMQSVFGSNAIEGIVTTDDRLRGICERKVEPVGHTESEIAGYRDALDLVHNGYAAMQIDIPTILELHRVMLSYTTDRGGQWKDGDNFIGHVREDGRIEVRFETLPYKETPEAMEQLVLAYRSARQDSSVNRLLLIPCFILDFLSVHPFMDGNGRTSRLLTLLMLYKEGYDVGRYVSFESMIYRNRPDYYDALAESSKGWHEGTNDYLPFIRNFLDTLFLCYKELDRRFATAVGSKRNKSSRVEYAVMNSLMPLSRREIREALPDVSDPLISKVLERLMEEGKVERLGNGPSTRYIRKRADPRCLSLHRRN